MEDVVALPEWEEVLERNPSNRQRFLDQDRREFITTMERWMLAYCPCGDELVPGLPSEAARALDVPALVFRSGESDAYHTRATSEQVAALLPNARLVGAAVGRPRVDRTRGSARDAGGSLFDRWYLLVPQLTEWSGEVFS